MPQQQLKWDDISVQEQLDVLVFDMIKGGQWNTLESFKQNKKQLQDALASKKQIWEQNKLERSAQQAHIETCKFYVEHDTIAQNMRIHLLNLLNK